MSQPPNLLQGPEPVETADLHFKLHCKLKAFESSIKYEDGNCSLLAVSQHYGLIFVGNLTGFSVIKTSSITSTTSYDEYPRREVSLSFKPIHIAVDHSQKFLAVGCTSKPGSILHLYNIASFSSKEFAPIKVIPLSKLVQNLASDAVDLMWQPNPDSELMVCMSDGSVIGLSQWDKEGSVYTLPNTTQAMCLCWSPKGKQIVIGCANGTLSQYKPDLKLVKTLPAPPLFNGAAAVVNVLWISSYQFAVAYSDRNSPDSFPVITIVNAAKNEPINVINYDDITYSTTFFRHHQIYMFHQSAWNTIFVSSGNSIEVAVLHSKDSLNWEQWLLGDASRAELPLNADRQETFPLGFAFDYTSKDVIPWGEGTLPPMPRLLLLSDEGVLCIFNVVNAMGNAAQLCGPPKEVFDDSLFTKKTSAPLLPEPPTMIQTSQAFTVQPAPAFGSSTPAPTLGPSAGFGGFSTQIPSSVPEVTISIPGGPMVGGVKDVLQQQMQLQQILLQQQQQKQQQQQQQQQPIVVSVMTPNAAAKTTSSAPFFTTPPKSAFSLGMTNTTPNFSFGSKPFLAQTPAPSTNSASQGSIFNNKAASPQSGIFTTAANIVQSTPMIVQSTPMKQPEAPEKASPKKGEEACEPVVVADDNSGKGKSPGGSPVSGTPELAVVDDSVYWNALQDEIDHFNSELQQLSVRVGSLDIQVGSEEDKENLRKRIASLHEFCKDLKETTASQSSEIHSVVTDLMESFAWLEDAKSRNLQRKNPSFIELKKSQELDPISARHMSDISHLKYYIVTQIKQLSSHLVKEWMDHQDSYRMEVKNKMTLPSLEEVYKTMHFQLKILNKQRALVQELKESLMTKKRKNKTHESFVSNSSQMWCNSQGGNRISELSKLADNLLQLKINKDDNHSRLDNWEIVKAQLKSICERSEKLSSNKQAALRDVLSERGMTKIRPVKKNFESSSFLRTLPLESKMKVDKRSVETKTDTGRSVLDIKEKEKVTEPPAKPKTTPSPKPVAKPETKVEKVEVQEKATINKFEAPKSIFVFGGGQPSDNVAPLTVQPPPNKTEANSPLVSLSSIVSSIGKENEAKANTFTFGTPKFQVSPQQMFGSAAPAVSKPQQKPEELKTTFTFGMSKPSELVFKPKTEVPKFEGKSTFGAVTLTPAPSSKPEVTKTVPAPSVSISVVTSTAASSSPFSFSFTPPTTTSAMTLPKMNILFGGKEQTSGFGATTTTGNLFLMNPAQNSGSSLFGSPTSTSTSIFGSSSKKPEASTISLFGVPKTTAEAVVQPTGFKVSEPAESKSVASNETAAETVAKASSPKVPESTEEVKAEETAKKSEAASDSSFKSSPKAAIAPTVSFGLVSTPAKSVADTTTTTTTTTTSSAPPNVQIVSASQSLVSSTTASVITKPIVATTVETTTSSVTQSPATATVSAATSAATSTATTTSGFTFSTSSSPLVFGQAASTASPVTTSTSIFGEAPKTTASVFGQVFSTPPQTTNIFGGAATTPTTPATNIFGNSTPTKPVFGQAAAAPSTPTSGSIFGGTTPTTPTTNTFGQMSTPTTSPSVFGQKPDAVAQTANIFGQLLSDSNRSGSVFGTTSATSTTTANIFSTPKNIFGGSSTTSTNLFGTTSSSIFPQTTSVFGQPTTSSSIFGQSETSTSNSFFGQNICSPFGGGTSTTSNQSSFESGGFGSKPVFGQSVFGQTTSNTSIFGGSPNRSLFGTSSTSSGGNVFQTPTTSTFGSTTSGPFSSGGGSVAETGFGAGNSFQKPAGSGFGSAPVFGRGPATTSAFGAPATFAGAPTFGSMSTFGSRPGVFDSSQGGFSPPQGHSTTFEDLANQNKVGFGSLAQQSKGQGFGGGGFGGSPAFENKSVFGGNSFSTWR